ncbi:recombinase family protein [Blautia sp. An249]|uniref:recombinase family protein n=1 Tax=Blautia sp. An249 TaxID=1965603 RepID=UPI000B3B06E7|nr:recombinase family protein [Blautia sp. An249]OUO78361.1 recombinase family protein [Blautia sp. An249]
MRVAAYCRVSTDKTDQMNSLETQKKFFLEFTRRNQYQLADLYADEGISGTKIKNRKEFQRLMEDAGKGLFDMVAVKDISRFARNTVDFLQSIRTLKGLGIETTFLTANMTVLGNSEFVLTIFGALAQEESANTSKRVKFGKKMNAQKGRVPNLVYGYDKTPGDYFHLQINLQEAFQVRRIYDWYEKEGYGAGKIAGLLNARGYQTKRGCQWSQNAVCRILTNPLYTGKVINGKEEVADFLTGARVEKEQEEWMVAQRPELKIIEPSQFERVQEILCRRRETFQTDRKRHSSRYLFSTLIQCKECGWSYRRIQRTYKNTYVRWTCSGRSQNGVKSCHNHVTVDETVLIQEIQDYFIHLLERQGVKIREIRKEMEKQLSLQKTEKEEEKQWVFHLRKLEKRREKYREMFLEDLIEKEELRQRTETIGEEIRELKEKIGALHPGEGTKEQIRQILKEQFQELRDFLSFEELGNGQIKQLVEKIEIDGEGRVQIYLKKAKL